MREGVAGRVIHESEYLPVSVYPLGEMANFRADYCRSGFLLADKTQAKLHGHPPVYFAILEGLWTAIQYLPCY